MKGHHSGDDFEQKGNSVFGKLGKFKMRNQVSSAVSSNWVWLLAKIVRHNALLDRYNIMSELKKGALFGCPIQNPFCPMWHKDTLFLLGILYIYD